MMSVQANLRKVSMYEQVECRLVKPIGSYQISDDNANPDHVVVPIEMPPVCVMPFWTFLRK